MLDTDPHPLVLQFHTGDQPLDMRRKLTWHGMSAEYFHSNRQCEFCFDWLCARHTLTLNDLRLSDGDTHLEGVQPIRLLDRRDRMTFIPKGCGTYGWGKLARPANSVTFFNFDPHIIAEELDRPGHATDYWPMLWFENRELHTTISKLRSLLMDPAATHSIYAETLGLLAAIEIDRLQKLGVDPSQPRETGQLSTLTKRRIGDYIAENLHRNISLSDLASIAQLSRFHFTRAFKKSFGMPPHQYILRSRVECAKHLLLASSLSANEIGQSLGFGSQGQFATVFRRVIGVTPANYRRCHG
jgi:AraC family transcriptional regulator